MDKSHLIQGCKAHFFSFFSLFFTPSCHTLAFRGKKCSYVKPNIIVQPCYFIYMAKSHYSFILYGQIPTNMIRTKGRSPKHFYPPLLLQTVWKDTMSSVLIELGKYVDEKRVKLLIWFGWNMHSLVPHTTTGCTDLCFSCCKLFVLGFFVHVELQMIKTSTSLENNLQSYFTAMSRQEIHSFFLSSELPWMEEWEH